MKKVNCKRGFLQNIHGCRRKNLHYIVLMIMGEVVAERDLKRCVSGEKMKKFQ